MATALTFKIVQNEIEKVMQGMLKYRDENQPVNERTAGCTFANPTSELSVWKLISDARCQGLKNGGAVISEKHGNFLINRGDASAEELERLGETVQRMVFENSGYLLRWEVERLGLGND